ncbi:hypothetical protein DFJ74DRAFT_662565 [Hyaloraphidium curvatum]|nr:hypothetical protein DFJ74DRAFT_662565 [Hyaloraphidium curvatum]
METPGSPLSELPPEIIYHVASFLPRRTQLELAWASRAAFELVAPLAFAVLEPLPSEEMDRTRVEQWRRNGWLGYVRRVVEDDEGWWETELLLELFVTLPRLVFVRIDFETLEYANTLLGAVPGPVEEMDVHDSAYRRTQAEGDYGPSNFPRLRRLSYSCTERLADGDRMLANIVSKSPDLHDLSLKVYTSDAFDFKAYLGRDLIPKVKSFSVISQQAFRALCSAPAFQPRRINIAPDEFDEEFFDFDYFTTKPQTVAAIARLQSVRVLDLDSVNSTDIAEHGLPPHLEQLMVPSLPISACWRKGGVDRITAILESLPHLRITASYGSKGEVDNYAMADDQDAD